jgi:hypothetical protein
MVNKGLIGKAMEEGNVNQFEAISRNLLGGTENIDEKPQSRKLIS